MARSTGLEKWERRLKQIFDQIDAQLEEQYGHLYPLHPVRPSSGSTADRSKDGLFEIGAAFTAGFGSKLGRGYAVEVRLATLAQVPQAVQEQIELQVIDILRRELPRYFPGRNLQVDRDNHVYKIYGDLRLETDKPDA